MLYRDLPRNLALFYGVDRSTITRAVHEIRPLLAVRGFAVAGKPGLRLRTLADVFAYAAAEGVELRIDGTEVQVRRPRVNRPGRRAFVSGKRRQNTKKATVITDGAGATLWTGAIRPGRMHDQTALKTAGICELLARFPQVKAKVDAGYRGLAKQFPGQVCGPPLKPAKDAPAEETARWQTLRKAQSSQRICVEHANADRRTRLRPDRQTMITTRQPARPARPSLNRAPRRYRSGKCGSPGCRLPSRGWAATRPRRSA